MTNVLRKVAVAALAFLLGCGGGSSSNGTGGSAGGSAGRGGATGSAGTTGTGGTTGGAGATGTGGAAGATGTGGTAGAAGATGTAGTTGAAGAGGGAAAGGRGGVGGSAGNAGRGGTGGTSVATCPAAPPQPGSNCTGGLNCYYEDCAGAGRTIASCVTGSAAAPRWQVTTGACTPVSCSSSSSLPCPAGQLCYIAAGGAVLATCGPNTCGTSPISCDCLQCGGICTVNGSLQSGITVTCNTCPQGGCP
jgi:hypothetical protein